MPRKQASFMAAASGCAPPIPPMPPETTVQAMELFVIGPAADQVGVGDQNARGGVVRLEDAHRFAGLDKQCFIVAEGADDGFKGRPIARGPAGAAVDDQIFGFFGDLGIEVVHEHTEGGFLMPAPARDFAASGCSYEVHTTSIFSRSRGRGALGSSREGGVRRGEAGRGSGVRGLVQGSVEVRVGTRCGARKNEANWSSIAFVVKRRRAGGGLVGRAVFRGAALGLQVAQSGQSLIELAR